MLVPMLFRIWSFTTIHYQSYYSTFSWHEPPPQKPNGIKGTICLMAYDTLANSLSSATHAKSFRGI